MKALIIISFWQITIASGALIEVKSNNFIPKKIKALSAKKKSSTRINNFNTPSSSELDEVKKLDNSSSREIKNYLDKNAIAVWDFTNRFDVKTGTAIRGVLLNSVVSTNLESPILIETTETLSGIPEGSKFSCIGSTKNKRVLTACNKLITDSDEYEVDTILLNNDGTAGLMGKLYSGKAQYAVGAITAAALKSVLDVSLDRVNNSYGTETITTSAKNKIKGGGIGAMDEIAQMSAEEYKTQEPKISIEAGKTILIYFNRRFKQ
jgi:hypothetical protein